MKAPAHYRIGATHAEDPTLGIIGLACDLHAQEAKRAGWHVHPYDGPGLCGVCS